MLLSQNRSEALWNEETTGVFYTKENSAKKEMA